jgi:predicted nucleic acid-binding protein
MAKVKGERIYWDACCFLEILNAGPHGITCRDILKRAERKEIEIVIKPKGQPAPLPIDMRDYVLSFFENDYIQLVNLDRLIVRQSLDLCWEYNLKARDALHIAAALSVKCNSFETIDDKLIGLDRHFPTMEIRQPRKGQGEIEYGVQQ